MTNAVLLQTSNQVCENWTAVVRKRNLLLKIARLNQAFLLAIL